MDMKGGGGGSTDAEMLGDQSAERIEAFLAKTAQESGFPDMLHMIAATPAIHDSRSRCRMRTRPVAVSV